jgi:acetylornithine deacetylase/succinyl-diaminopimelate desuccinylase family protein
MEKDSMRAEKIKKVVDSIDEEGVKSLLREMVRIPSLSGNEEALADLIAKAMERCGLSVEMIGGNVVGKFLTTASAPTLVLNGHMDTVPVGDRAAWSVDPFGGECQDGKIYGRGAADMKGGLASMIMAVDALHRSRIELKGNLILTAVIMEELAEKLSQRRGVVELIDKEVIRGDAAIVGEPTSLNVSLGHRGRAVFEVLTHGKSAHASMPKRGVNAIEKMAEIIQSLKALKMGDNKLLGSGTFNIGVIEGGTKPNVVPDLCKIKIDRRLTFGETPQTAERDLQKIIDDLKRKDTSLQPDVRCLYQISPTLTSASEPVVSALGKSVEAVTGRKPKKTVSTFHSDGGFITHLAKLPVVIFGPGDEKTAHTADEHIDSDQLVDATKIYANSILKFYAILSRE